jgi:hypothetical protein
VGQFDLQLMTDPPSKAIVGAPHVAPAWSHSAELLQSCTLSDEHGPGSQLDDSISVPPGHMCVWPQHACPGMQSADALQFRPSTHDRSVFIHVPSSKHLNHTATSPPSANCGAGHTELPGHVHGSPLSGGGQYGGTLEWSPALLPSQAGTMAPTATRTHRLSLSIGDLRSRLWPRDLGVKGMRVRDHSI